LAAVAGLGLLAACAGPSNAQDLPSKITQPRQYLIGVNIAGAEFRNKDPDYGWPSDKILDYFQTKGIKLIRLPFMWERIQPTLGGELDPRYTANLVNTIERIGKRDMVVLLDLHNYAKYNEKTISQGGFTYEQFGDVWDKIAKAVAPQQKHIWGYGLMNEPYIVADQKIPFWQAGIDAVRKHDPKTRITVSGEALKSESDPKQFHLKDPARAIVYESHFYFDHDGNGKYAKTYEEEISRPNPRVNPMIGVERIKKFIEVCEKHQVDCMIGEFGVPAGDGVDPRWLDAMDNVMKYMHEHRITSTYWAAGEFWTRRGTSYIIGENGWKPGEHEGEDRPQLKILMKYIQMQKDGK
jgi:endoglucanase